MEEEFGNVQPQRRKHASQAQQPLQDIGLYYEWKKACDKVFSQFSGKLPEPPSWPCSVNWCDTEVRQLKACRHNLKRLFISTGDLQGTLQEERKRWHPNRGIFYRLQGEDAIIAARMATEITQTIQNLPG